MDPVGDSAYSASSSDRPPAPAARRRGRRGGAAGRARRSRRWSARPAQLDDALDDGALWWRASERYSSNTASRSSSPRKRMTLRRRAQPEGRSAGRPGDLDERRSDLPDARHEHAPVKGVEPSPAPPKPAEGQRQRRSDAAATVRHRDGGDRTQDRGQEHPDPRCAQRERSGEAEAERGRQSMRREALEERDPYGATSSRSCSSRAGPIPGSHRDRRSS